jgi:hypothetical protein
MADDDMDIKIGADFEGVNRGVDQVKAKLAEVGEATHEAGAKSEGGFEGFVEALKAPLEALESMKASIAARCPLPGRLSEAGRQYGWIGRDRPASETLHHERTRDEL